MSVLILDMKFPKTCAECEWSRYSFPNAWCGRTHKTADIEIAKNGRPDWCPLVPVPPNGDLIDRRYAIATACSGRIRTLPTTEDGENWIRVEEVRKSIKDAPTIIPAEEGE